MGLICSLLLAAVAATNEPPAAVETVPGATASTNAVEAVAKTNRIARITAASTYYDSKDGVAFFSGHVYVDDEEYQLHADRAYVFMNKDGTNDLKRIVALGNVALTNGTKMAYGAKVSYHRDSGMVVLYGDEAVAAEVRDEKDNPPQVVVGDKIKFWTDSQQVLVEKARISAPVTGAGMNSLKNSIGGKK